MMKRILPLLLIAFMLTVLSTPVTAAESYRCIGDIDGDDSVSILDATLIQKQLASLKSFSRLQNFLGDVDNSQTTDIIDATLIQKRLASLIDNFYRERIQSWKSEIYGIESSNNSNTYLLNTEYSFSVSATQRPIPDEFRVLVDQDIVLDHTEEKDFAYTFTEAGIHYIRAYCYGAWGKIDSCLLTVIVTDPNAVEKPRITSAYYDKKTSKVEVTATGGSSPYQYAYTIRQVPPPPPNGEPYTHAAEFVFRTDENGEYTLYCDFCDGIDVFIPTYLLSKNLNYVLEIQALDSNGVLSPVKTIQIPV